MQTIRHISLQGLMMTRDASGFSDEYLNKATTAELEEAIARFDQWWERVASKHLPLEEQNDGHLHIMGMCDAYENYAREDGLRTGMRLLHEALCCNTPSVIEVERRANKR